MKEKWYHCKYYVIIMYFICWICSWNITFMHLTELKNQGVFVKHYAPPSEKATFSTMVKVKVICLGVIWKGIISWVYMPNYNEASISCSSKVIANVKVDNLQTNRLTGQKQYAPDHKSIWGHENAFKQVKFWQYYCNTVQGLHIFRSCESLALHITILQMPQVRWNFGITLYYLILQMPQVRWNFGITLYYLTDASGQVKFWHYTSGKCLHTINEARQTLCVATNPDGSRFLTTGDTEQIHIYDEETKTKTRTLEPRWV